MSPGEASGAWECSHPEPVRTTGRHAPARNISFDVSAPGRSGRHSVFTIWQASRMDQAYSLCGDVNFR